MDAQDLLEDEINSLIYDFQMGIESSTEKLIEHYMPLIKQFVSLIKYKVFRPSSYSQRVFISMFAKDRTVARKLRSLKYGEIRILEAAQNILSFLEGCYKFTDEEELRQDVVEVLLNTLKRYRYKGRGKLNGYINIAFLANLARKVKSIIKDPLVNLANDKIISYCELQPPDDSNTVDGFREVGKLEHKEQLFLLEDDELGNNWVTGLTCGNEFKNLTPYERYLVKLYYYDDLSPAEVCEIFGIRHQTLKKTLISIVKRIGGQKTEVLCKECGKDFFQEIAGRKGRRFSSCLKCRSKKNNDD